MATTEESREEGLYSYDSFGGGKKTSSSNFLWWCAGAQQQLLRQFPSEGIKYAGLGGVLLATFVLAALSSGYAIYSVFGSWGWTLGFALIWGFIIFNFDRFLVSTMRKYGLSRRKQVLMAIPRLALALLIGLTIARPLELKLFEKEIAVKMEENRHQKMQRNDSLLQIETAQQLSVAEGERARMQARKTAIEDTLYGLQQSYVREADGTGGSGQRGIERLTRLKMEAYQAANTQYAAELSTLAAGIARQDSLMAAVRGGLEGKRDAYAAMAAANQGFLEKNKALADLQDEESSVWWSCLLISLLIILIEVGPVLSKLMMPVGPYDIALAREELLSMAAEENDIRKGKEIAFEKKKLFYQKQKQMTEALVDRLTELQKKHIEVELDKWERGEWSEKDHRASMDEVLRKIREKYKVEDDSLL
jgi:hypothetical protein